MTSPKPQILACNSEALTSAQRKRYNEISKQLRLSVKQIRELRDGYVFRYASDPSLFMAAAEFVSLESRCCSFYRFTLVQDPSEGSIWLRIIGPKQAKAFIKPILSP